MEGACSTEFVLVLAPEARIAPARGPTAGERNGSLALDPGIVLQHARTHTHTHTQASLILSPPLSHAHRAASRELGVEAVGFFKKTNMSAVHELKEELLRGAFVRLRRTAR